MSQSPSYLVGEDLAPSVFVKPDAANDHTVLLAGAGDSPIGVTQEGTREAPIPGITPLAAKAGETCRIYGEDETCEVVAGGAIANGDYVKPDASGHAIVAAAADAVGGRAEASAAAGELCRITVKTERAPT